MLLPNPPRVGGCSIKIWNIENAGVELQAAYRINTAWSVDANYSFLHMEKPVIAAPEHKLYAGAGFTTPLEVFTGPNILQVFILLWEKKRYRGFCVVESSGQFSATKMAYLWARGETCWHNNTR